MSKKKGICKYCGAKAEHWCDNCGSKDRSGKKQNNICFTHTVFVEIGATLENMSAVGLSKHKGHPSMCYCSKVEHSKVKGCAKKKIKALLEA